MLKFRLHGLRKLNWIERASVAYDKHLQDTGFDRWIEIGPLTIIVGPNGGGKSTVIDLLRAIADASLWPSLARENYGGDDFSGFDIEGTDFILSGRFSKYTPDVKDTFEKLTIIAVAKGSAGGDAIHLLAPKFRDATGWDKPLQELLNNQIGLQVSYYPPTGGYPGGNISDRALVVLLNELSPHFPSVLANKTLPPFALFQGASPGPGRIGILFKDDSGQHAFVNRDALPLGWLQLASIIDFLRSCPPNNLILLDEPDRHLHPSLQRVLLELIASEAERSKSQIVMATHSSVLINPELCAQAGAQVIVTARGRCEHLTGSRNILDDLGVTSGDLVQANGVIWVEGPSDRIYLKRWFERYARHIGETPPIERVHYAFVSYGGALLKHIGVAEASADRVDLRSINRNFVVVIDRDLTPSTEEGFEGEKGRILAEAIRLKAEKSIWITQFYTIEA